MAVSRMASADGRRNAQFLMRNSVYTKTYDGLDCNGTKVRRLVTTQDVTVEECY